MPRIIDYPTVLDTMERAGLRCSYPKGGAFGFRDDAKPRIQGWIGPEDSTIRPAVLALARKVSEPYPQTLAAMAINVWERGASAGPLWIMPASHWAFELDFGSAAWLHDAIRRADIDPASLAPRTDGSAVEFEPAESAKAQRLISDLLAKLVASDFTLAFPGRSLACLVHHHKQLWWQATEEDLFLAIQNA